MHVGFYGNPLVNLSRNWDIVWMVDVIGAFWPNPIYFSSA